MTWSIAMTGDLASELTAHLARSDGQEDLCLATYRPSTGRRRTTAILTEARLPGAAERSVHGNASVTGDYVERVALEAAANGHGVALLHSHPGARGWQSMSSQDRDAEASFANLVRELTGHPWRDSPSREAIRHGRHESGQKESVETSQPPHATTSG